MSGIDDAFTRAARAAGIEQHPNWAGVVYGVCQTPNCPNKTVGDITGGFCKMCSTRLRESEGLAPISTVTRNGVRLEVPNPRIKWKLFRWVNDMSHTMTPKQKKDFYDAPPGYMD